VSAFAVLPYKILGGTAAVYAAACFVEAQLGAGARGLSAQLSQPVLVVLSVLKTVFTWLLELRLTLSLEFAGVSLRE
jgi:hypothetical protein